MKITPTAIPGVLIIEPKVFRDDRGLFVETFNDERFVAHGLPGSFRQDNLSRSVENTLRGLHYQLNRPQGKLITVIRGEVFDVAVDIRRGSPTFGRYEYLVINGDEPKALWVPPGMAHGYQALTPIADVVYRCTDLYDPTDDRGVLWNDPRIGIPWPRANPKLSDKDKRLLPLDESRDDLPIYTGD